MRQKLSRAVAIARGGVRVSLEVERVKDAVDIVPVVGEHVQLRRAGASGRYVGLCPFHDEKTASFSVNQTHQFYKCFGCGEGGDVFDFVARIESVSFAEALHKLAERAGITLVGMTEEARRQYRVLRETREQASLWAVTAELLADSALEVVAINDATPFAITEIRRIARAGGSELLAEFRAWREKFPELTAGMVRAGQAHEERISRRLMAYVAELPA
jgi:DNA primase